MVAVSLGQTHETGPVEIDAAKVHVIRVLVSPQAAREEPHFTLFGINVDDVANHPGALRDPVLQSPGGDVTQIEMTPAVALAHPQQFVCLVQPMSPSLIGVVDERL